MQAQTTPKYELERESHRHAEPQERYEGLFSIDWQKLSHPDSGSESESASASDSATSRRSAGRTTGSIESQCEIYSENQLEDCDMDVAGLGPVSYFEAEAEFLILDMALDIPLPEEEGGEENGMEVEVDQEDQEEEGEDEQNGRDEEEEGRDEEEENGDEEDGDEEEDEEEGYEEYEENEVIGNSNGLLTAKLNPNWRNRYFVVNYGLVLEYHNTPEGVHLGPIDIFGELFVLCGQEFLPAELENHDKSVHWERDDDGDNQWSDMNIDAQFHRAETYAPEYSSSSESLDLHMGRHSFLADDLHQIYNAVQGDTDSGNLIFKSDSDSQTSSMQISLASSRTQSTEYGIYYRRMAISQDTLESYVYHDQNDFVIQL